MSISRPSGPRRNTTLSKDTNSTSNFDSALTSTIDPEDGNRPEDQDRPRLGRRTTISSSSTSTTTNTNHNNSSTTTPDQPNRPGLERGSSSAFIGGSLHRPKLTQARSRGKSFIGSTSLQDDLVLPSTTVPSTTTSNLTTTPKRERTNLNLDKEKDEESDTLRERLITRNSPRNSLSPLTNASTTSTNSISTTNSPRSSKLGRGSLARRASSSSSLSTISASATIPALALSSTSKSTLASKEAQTGSSTGSTDLLSPLREQTQLGASASTSPSSSNPRAKTKPRPHRSASVRDVPTVSIHLEGVPLEDDHDHDHDHDPDMDHHHENAQASSSSSNRMSATSSSSPQSQAQPTGRRGNRPASKSVSSVLGRPSHLAGIARTSTHHASNSNPSYTPERRAPSILLDRIGEFDDERYAHLQQRRPSRDESGGVENKSSGSNSTNVAAGTTVTRSRSTSIAKHPEVVDLHARHSRLYDPTSDETLGGVASSSPAPTRLGLTRRISAPNVRSPGSGSGAALPGGMKDEILPTLPVGPEDVGGTNSLGLSKVSPGRSKGFQRFSPSPLIEPRIMEESGSQPSSPELDLDLDGPPPARALVLSPPPGRTSLSTIASTTEGEGSVSTVDRTASYPITPRGSIPNEQDDAGNSGFNILGGVIQGLGKAVGFNLSNSARYASISHHDYAADEDDNETDQQRQTRSWISLGKRRSLEDTDSEKGLNSREPSDDEGAGVAQGGGARSTRTGGSSSRRPDGGSYFFLEPYASQEASGSSRGVDTLPTPALSRASLSGLQARPASGRASSSLFERRRPGAAAGGHGFAASLWRVKDYLSGTANKGRNEVYVMKKSAGFSSPEAKAERLARGRSDSLLLPKLDADDTAVGMNTAFRQVVGELGWTLGMMGIVFFASFGLVAFGIKSMPITSLHSLPKKVSDLQILSAEIRTYMSSSSRGWWHTVCVLMITGMWKHSWSIPGALILNILVGSLLSPIPALILLTVITSFGSLGAYMLSRPLAPLIALLFPKPLAIVRSAIKGNAEPAPSIGPYQAVRKPSAAAEGGVWRRLLIMRAMGLVPWSGMNVACGVVGVSWLTFLLTTAAGSASWSYVTASVGDILGQLALPKDPGNGDTDPNAGQSIASLVQDPALVAKMVVLSLISLIPALFKSRSGTIDTAPPAEIEAELEGEYHHPHVSQDTQAMTPLAPTASWWQAVHFANLLIRKTTRIAHTGWNAVVGEARDEYRHLQPVSE